MVEQLTGVRVRRAAEADLEAVVTVLRELHDPPTAVADPETWDAILEQAGRIILVAEADGRVVGTADMLIVPNLTHGGAPWIWVENLVVVSTHRRRGVGRALIGNIERRAREMRAYKLQLLSRNERERAHTFYLALGFERCAEGFRKYLPDEWETDSAGWVHRLRHEPFD